MCKSANENHNFLYLCNFMDENIDIQSLVQKYEQMCASGKKIYFDPEEFALLAEHYNAVGDDEKSINLIEEGLAIHPTNPDLMLLRAKVLVFDEQFEEALEYIKEDEYVEITPNAMRMRKIILDENERKRLKKQ